MWDPLPRPLSLKGEGWPPEPLLRRGRLRRAGLATLVAMAGFCLSAGAAAPRHVVKDPYFGDSLFYFYQQRYFTSLTDLMVSQHFARLTHHADEAELLRGGMYLSYGLHREAGEIF